LTEIKPPQKLIARLDTDLTRNCAPRLCAPSRPAPVCGPESSHDAQRGPARRAMVKSLSGEESEGALRWRKVIPYGLLFGPRFYVVARVKSKAEPFLFRLDRMHDLEVTNEAGTPPESFDLEAYASRSFGVFQEEAEDIVLRFDPSAAPDAQGYLFHPTQPWSPRRMDRSRFVSAQRAFANRPSPHNLGFHGDHSCTRPAQGHDEGGGRGSSPALSQDATRPPHDCITRQALGDLAGQILADPRQLGRSSPAAN
jgi:hypothetical protein